MNFLMQMHAWIDIVYRPIRTEMDAEKPKTTVRSVYMQILFISLSLTNTYRERERKIYTETYNTDLNFPRGMREMGLI